VNERAIYTPLPLMNCHFHSSSPNATDESERVLGVLTNVCSDVCDFEELRFDSFAASIYARHAAYQTIYG
jgi:hypothetical protein